MYESLDNYSFILSFATIPVYKPIMSLNDFVHSTKENIKY